MERFQKFISRVLAYDILRTCDYNDERIVLVQSCIRKHRGSY